MPAAVSGPLVDPMPFEGALADRASKQSAEPVVVLGVGTLGAQVLYSDEAGIADEGLMGARRGDCPLVRGVAPSDFDVAEAGVVRVGQLAVGATAAPNHTAGVDGVLEDLPHRAQSPLLAGAVRIGLGVLSGRVPSSARVVGAAVGNRSPGSSRPGSAGTYARCHRAGTAAGSDVPQGLAYGGGGYTMRTSGP